MAYVTQLLILHKRSSKLQLALIFQVNSDKLSGMILRMTLVEVVHGGFSKRGYGIWSPQNINNITFGQKGIPLLCF